MKKRGQRPIYPARLTIINARTSRGVRADDPFWSEVEKAPALTPELGLAPIRLAIATLMVTVHSKIAFSCTCHPAKNDANADKTTDPMNLSKVGFLNTEIKLGICSNTVKIKVCWAVTVGKTPNAVSPTSPRVVAERADSSRARLKYCPRGVLETKTIMILSANEYRAQKLAAQYEWVSPRLKGNKRPAS